MFSSLDMSPLEKPKGAICLPCWILSNHKHFFVYQLNIDTHVEAANKKSDTKPTF